MRGSFKLSTGRGPSYPGGRHAPGYPITADQQLPSLLSDSTLIVPIGLDILTEYIIIFIILYIFCISMSDE